MNNYLTLSLVLVVLIILGFSVILTKTKPIPFDVVSTSTTKELDVTPSLASSTETTIINNNQNTKSMINPQTQTKPIVVLITTLGKIEVELFADQTPNTVKNFLKLTEAGFYDGVLFHRVIPNFMIQGGDPLTKSDPQNWAIHGTGGPGYHFADEIKPINSNLRGTISMANAGPNTNGSQFFINIANNDFLNTKHTVFGRVIDGMEVVEKIAVVKTNEADHPLENIQIQKIEIK